MTPSKTSHDLTVSQGVTPNNKWLKSMQQTWRSPQRTFASPNTIRVALDEVKLGEKIVDLKAGLRQLPRAPPVAGEPEGQYVHADKHALDLDAGLSSNPPMPTSSLPPKGHTVMKRTSSRRTTARSIRSDVDKASISSIPNVLPDVGRNEHYDQDAEISIDLARSFMKRGELHSAEVALLQSKHVLETSHIHENSLYTIKVNVQLASIKHLRGKYNEAYHDFRAILSKLNEDQSDVRIKAEVEIWIAISLIYLGKYSDAETMLKYLVKTSDTAGSSKIESAELQMRRDLAFTYACRGNYSDAKDELEKAYGLLDTRDEQLSKPPLSTDGTHVRSGDSQLQTEGQTDKFRCDLTGSSELRAKRDLLHFTEAKIGLMWGEYLDALESSGKALIGMSKRWGSKHLKTLECASLYALLLAISGRVAEGQTTCTSTVQIMRQELGPQHPETVEAMCRLIRIYKMQCRLAEAVATARSLAKTARSTMPEEHPQVLRSGSLLAEMEMAVGNYASAKKELQRTVEISCKYHGTTHPDTLEHRSSLALALYHCGATDDACSLALEVLSEQRKLYLNHNARGKQRNSAGGNMHMDKLRGNDTSKLAAKLLLDNVIDIIGSDQDTTIIHPSLLFTLRILGLIGQRKADSDGLKLARQIFNAIRTRHPVKISKSAISEEQSQALRESPMITLDSEHDFALFLRESADENNYEQNLAEAADCLRYVYRSRSDILSWKHPSTQRARRDLIITNIILGRWEDMSETAAWLVSKDTKSSDQNRSQMEALPEAHTNPLNAEGWKHIEVSSLEIFRRLEGQLGSRHPETLQSLLWVLTIQALIRKDEVLGTYLKKARDHLHDKSTRDQRLAECLHLEHKLATIICDLSFTDTPANYAFESLEMFRSISEAVDQLSANDSAVCGSDLLILRKNTEDDIMRVLRKAQASSRPRKDELQALVETAQGNAEYDEAERYQDELCQLLSVLYGSGHTHSLEAQKKLMELKIRTKDPKKIEEGEQILHQLRASQHAKLDSTFRRSIEQAAQGLE